MRVRHKRVQPLKHISGELTTYNESHAESEQSINSARPVEREKRSLFRSIIGNPNLAFQVMVIVLTLASDNVRMDRRIDNMTGKVDTIRGIAEVINSTMQSVKVAAEAPRHIRKLLE